MTEADERPIATPSSLAQVRHFLRQDFAVNPGWQSRLTLSVFRVGQFLYRVDSPPARPILLIRKLWQISYVTWTQLITGAEFPPEVQCGPALRLPHAGRGVVLHPGVAIGSHATIYHRTTIGVRGAGGAAKLGENVYLGTGASVLGEVAIGDNVRIGAHTVVVEDVPAGATVVGPKGRVIVGHAVE